MVQPGSEAAYACNTRETHKKGAETTRYSRSEAGAHCPSRDWRRSRLAAPLRDAVHPLGF